MSQHSLLIFGIHLSGSNSAKTALVGLEVDTRQSQAEVSSVYEKIGSFGSLFSDERVVEILSSQKKPVAAVFVDSPLSVPPCVACTRPTCPGVMRCEDVEVAVMLAHSHEEKTGERPKRRAPINPQSHRLWDVTSGREFRTLGLEPTYSANLAPLVVRGKTLQRRLRQALPALALQETSIPLALTRLKKIYGWDEHIGRLYRQFHTGRQQRQKIVENLLSDPQLGLKMRSLELKEKIFLQVEVFQAFIAAVVGWLSLQEKVDTPPRHQRLEDGWVYLPR